MTIELGGSARDRETADCFAFVDASGDHSRAFDKPNVPTHFVMVAVVPRGDCETLRGTADRIRAEHFGTAEMKSSAIGKNVERRCRIIRDLTTLDAHAYAVAVDKTKIDPESGLIFKKPFQKFLHDKLYARLLRAYQRVVVRADEHGRPAFMREMKTYFERKHPSTLFSGFEVEFVRSVDDPLVQVADIVAGTVSQCIDRSLAPEDRRVLIAASRSLSMQVEVWPTDSPIFEPDTSASGDDLTVFRCALRAADAFFERFDGETGDEVTERAKRALLYLLYRARVEEDSRYVRTHEIVEALSDREPDLALNPSQRPIRQAIGRLRDHGVLLASSQSGYKVPQSVADVLDFVTQSERVLNPMLHRLGKAHRVVRDATAGRVDILADPAVRAIRAAVELQSDPLAAADHEIREQQPTTPDPA